MKCELKQGPPQQNQQQHRRHDHLSHIKRGQPGGKELADASSSSAGMQVQLPVPEVLVDLQVKAR